MSLSFNRLQSLAFRTRNLSRIAFALSCFGLACREKHPVQPVGLVHVSVVEINDASAALERGSRVTLSATALDVDGDTVEVPVVWHSSDESVARFERGGVLVALDTGVTLITASTLGVASAPVPFGVVWFGPAFIDSGSFLPANARGPGVTLTDSVRVIVTNIDSVRVPNARVRFTVTEGGGSVSPATVTTGPNGIAATAWTLGPVAGRNVVTASVVRADGTPDTLVQDNAVTFVINSYNALTVQAGDNQTGQILSELPVHPSVKLVDSLGVPRAGVPVTFTAYANGRVTTPVVSTDAAGIASPGSWFLGDIAGTQMLEARVEDAKATWQATATGTPIYYKPVFVTTGGFTTCALETGGVVKCWGAELQIGTGDTTDIFTPTQVKGSLVAASVISGPTHNCALTSQGQAWCWGLNVFGDSTGSLHELEPKSVETDITWSQLSPGFAHNCGVNLLETAYCWGANSGGNAGQLGDGTTTDRRSPTAVTGGFKFSQVVTGGSHSCGLSNGSALCWGQNTAGQLGDGTTQPRTTPTVVSGGLTFQSIVAGSDFTCGLTAQPEGKTYCWGGISGAAQVTPSAYTSAPSFTALSANGGGHACALAADNNAYCWGNNNSGQLGDSSRVRRATPSRVAGDLRFTQISAGFLHTCGITTAGAVACWGNNRSGELGDTTATSRTTPRHVVIGVTP
jgi:alpha-tubulin suppressor-like RCC1 family protein